MLHSIPDNLQTPFAAPMTRAVEACVHCGFCLAACPTYRELGQEMDTPRGRIVLMKQVLEGTLSWQEAQPHVDRCLGCLACEPACPSGVPYRDLVTPFRVLAQPHFKRTPGQRLGRWLTLQTLPFPRRFRLAARFGPLARHFAKLLPDAVRQMLDLLPSTVPPAEFWPSHVPAVGPRRAKVALLLGCAQQVLAPDINSATIAVLSRNGVEVLIPPGQGCCGALAWHTGALAAAQRAARNNLRAFPSDVDAIVTNAAGCGSALHEYPLILKGTAQEELARAFSHRAIDVSAFLAKLGLASRPGGFNPGRRIAYHDACHLANAQQVRLEPRALLRSIPGVDLRELRDPEMCCGSAGTYNLDQPRIASALGAKKAGAILESGADLVVTGNIGCLVQLQLHLAAQGTNVPVRHTMQVLRDAYSVKGQ